MYHSKTKYLGLKENAGQEENNIPPFLFQKPFPQPLFHFHEISRSNSFCKSSIYVHFYILHVCCTWLSSLSLLSIFFPRFIFVLLYFFCASSSSNLIHLHLFFLHLLCFLFLVHSFMTVFIQVELSQSASLYYNH